MTNGVELGLAAKYAPDLLMDPTSRPDGREYTTGDLRPLQPALDLIEGVTYLGAHKKFFHDKELGKGKKKQTIRVPAIGPIVITSNGEWFPYTLYDLTARGWQMPTTAAPPERRRWSEESIEAYLEHPGDSPTPTSIFTAIRDVYDEYIRFSDPGYLDIMPLYIMLSYVFRAFTAVPYLHFNGMAGSGKSQNLLLMGAIGFNATMSSNITSSALFRTVAGWPGLVCADEFESSSREEMEPILSVFRSGYKRGSPAVRTQKDHEDQFSVANFNVFGPKAIASITQLEGRLRERCIVVATRKTLDKVPAFDDEHTCWQTLRDDLHIFALRHQAPINALALTWTREKRNLLAPNIENRPWELAFPLVVLAEYIDRAQLMPDIIAWLANYFAAASLQEAALDKTRLALLTLPTVLREGLGATPDPAFYKLAAIRKAIIERLEEDQKEKFSSGALAGILRNYGFPSQRSSGGTVVHMTEDMVRRSFAEQRLEPLEEDKAWYEGTEAPPAPARPSIWKEE